MPQLGSPISTPAGMPAANAAHVGKFPGAPHFATMAALTSAITPGATGYSADLWEIGKRMTISGEPFLGYRVWNGTHARTFVIAQAQIVLPADTSVVLRTSGAPAAGTGANGDLAVDEAAAVYYGPKTAGAWGTAVALSSVPPLKTVGGQSLLGIGDIPLPSGVSGGSTVPTVVAYSTTIPLDGNKRSADHQMTGPETLITASGFSAATSESNSWFGRIIGDGSSALSFGSGIEVYPAGAIFNNAHANDITVSVQGGRVKAILVDTGIVVDTTAPLIGTPHVETGAPNQIIWPVTEANGWTVTGSTAGVTLTNAGGRTVTAVAKAGNTLVATVSSGFGPADTPSAGLAAGMLTDASGNASVLKAATLVTNNIVGNGVMQLISVAASPNRDITSALDYLVPYNYRDGYGAADGRYVTHQNSFAGGVQLFGSAAGDGGKSFDGQEQWVQTGGRLITCNSDGSTNEDLSNWGFTPHASSQVNPGSGTPSGVAVTVPGSSTNLRTLLVSCGIHEGGWTLHTSLSDGSTAALDISLAQDATVRAIKFRTNSAGATMRVELRGPNGGYAKVLGFALFDGVLT